MKHRGPGALRRAGRRQMSEAFEVVHTLRYVLRVCCGAVHASPQTAVRRSDQAPMRSLRTYGNSIRISWPAPSGGERSRVSQTRAKLIAPPSPPQEEGFVCRLPIICGAIGLDSCKSNLCPLATQKAVPDGRGPWMPSGKGCRPWSLWACGVLPPALPGCATEAIFSVQRAGMEFQLGGPVAVAMSQRRRHWPLAGLLAYVGSAD